VIDQVSDLPLRLLPSFVDLLFILSGQFLQVFVAFEIFFLQLLPAICRNLPDFADCFDNFLFFRLLLGECLVDFE
jgi:hypothetical protein